MMLSALMIGTAFTSSVAMAAGLSSQEVDKVVIGGVAALISIGAGTLAGTAGGTIAGAIAGGIKGAAIGNVPGAIIGVLLGGATGGTVGGATGFLSGLALTKVICDRLEAKE